jgi:inositol hexakisphosphate/diphosphoinositol-pentakisphosphate kinase
LRSLYNKAKLLFDVVGPLEYGVEPAEKLEIGILNCSVLLKQIIHDLEAAKSSSEPCTRLYFTKESKVICLFNTVMLCGIPTKLTADVDELDCTFFDRSVLGD